MATNQPMDTDYDTISHFDHVAAQIEQTFDQLIDQLIRRREELLQKVLELREDFFNKESARREAIQELENAQEQLGQNIFKANLNIPIHQQTNQVYEQGMERLATPTKLPFFYFSCPTLDKLISLIDEFGELSEGINYFDKKVPILTAGSQGKDDGEFMKARGVSLDEKNEIIYIADSGNSRVQKFSFQAEFICSFGGEVLKHPFGIRVTDYCILITDITLDSLLRYDKKTLELIDRVGNKENEILLKPQGLDVDSNGDVYIAENRNHRVSIFSEYLEILSCIGQGKLNCPCDVKLTRESVIVLDWSEECLHFFSRNGDLLRSCITQGQRHCMVFCPLFFCLDKDNNILISDWNKHNIIILSTRGELFHMVGKKGIGSGGFIKTGGLASSDAGTIFVVSDNPVCILQVF